MSNFQHVVLPAQNRGVFSLGSTKSTSMDFGRLTPVVIQECTETDVISLNLHSFVRAAPNSGVLPNGMQLQLHAWFVPNRLVWSGWNEYRNKLSSLTPPYFTVSDLNTAILGHSDSNQRLESIRHISSAGIPEGLIAQGSEMLPNTNYNSVKLSAMPLRALKRIWFECYADPILYPDNQKSSQCLDTSGQISSAELYDLVSARYQCYAKDYISTAFLEPQEGESASVASFVQVASGSPDVPYESGSALVTNSSGKTSNLGMNERSPNLYNSSHAEILTSISSFRVSNAAQKLRERCLFAGKRLYTRFKALFNTEISSVRLDLCEYLGSSSGNFNFQTSTAKSSGANNSITDEPELSVMGVSPSDSSGNNMNGQQSQNGSITLDFNNITYSCQEAGFLIIIATIMPDQVNYQGVDRMWLRGLSTPLSSVEDWLFSDYEATGLQEVMQIEVAIPPVGQTTAQQTKCAADPKSIFGYQSKYADWRYSHCNISGDYILQATRNLLRNNHLGRNINFETGWEDINGNPSTPSAVLNYNQTVHRNALLFLDLKGRTAYDSKFTVTNASMDHFLADFAIKITANRPLNQDGIPSLDNTDHQHGNKTKIPTGGMRL